MSNFQRIIKYLAMAFAIFLVVSIFSGIISAFSLTNIFNSSSSNNLKNLDINGEVSILDVDIKSANIIIKEGIVLKAETNNKNINIKQDKNKLYITQKKYNWFNNDKSDLIIYIPSELIFEGVEIDGGAGKLDITKISTKELYLDLGAGKADIKELNVLDKTKIEGGAGSIDILSGKLNNLDFDMGVGKLTLTSIIKGNSNIKSGIGEVNLNLIGTSSDYKIKVDKGIGSVTIDGNDIKEDIYYGEGSNLIDIDGGIGAIKIKYVSE